MIFSEENFQSEPITLKFPRCKLDSFQPSYLKESGGICFVMTQNFEELRFPPDFHLDSHWKRSPGAGSVRLEISLVSDVQKPSFLECFLEVCKVR